MQKALSYIGNILAAVLTVLVLATVLAPLATAHVVAHATPAVSIYYNALAALVHGTGTGPALAIFAPMIGLKGKTYAQLIQDNTANSNQPEFFPMEWFDTATFTSASTSGNVNFFSNTNNDLSLSNMQLAGQFANNEYFDLGEIHVDVLERTTAETAGAADTAAVGAMDDLYQLMHSSRALITLNYRNKPYGPYPLSTCRPLGLPQVVTNGTFAAATAVQFGGWNATGLVFEKTLTIGPGSKFGITIFYPATLTLSQATCQLRVTLRGQHNRTVN